MKWMFLLFLVVLVPSLVQWIRTNKIRRPYVWALLGLLPFVEAPWGLSIAPISWGMWPGFVKGLEVSLLDAIALAVLMTAPRSKTSVPFKAPILAYLLASLIATSQASTFMAAAFYPWQLAKGFVLFLAVARICQDERAPTAIVSGMVAGLAIQAGYALIDRVQGAIQTGGSLGHQNTLGLMMHFAAVPALALLLSSKKWKIPLLGTASSVAVAVFGASRATIGLVGIGFTALLLVSGVRRLTPRKATVSMIVAASMIVTAPLAVAALSRRYEVAPVAGSYEERLAFERAAWMMVKDRPFGIGPNHYVVVANTGGYSERAGVIWNAGSRAAHVHNVYLVILAETGWLGLITYLWMILSVIFVAFRCAFRFRRDARGDLILGVGMGLVIVSLHSLYEWVLVTSFAQNMMFISIGLVAGLARLMGYYSPRQRSLGPASIQQRSEVPLASAPH